MWCRTNIEEQTNRYMQGVQVVQDQHCGADLQVRAGRRGYMWRRTNIEEQTYRYMQGVQVVQNRFKAQTYRYMQGVQVVQDQH